MNNKNVCVFRYAGSCNLSFFKMHRYGSPTLRQGWADGAFCVRVVCSFVSFGSRAFLPPVGVREARIRHHCRVAGAMMLHVKGFWYIWKPGKLIFLHGRDVHYPNGCRGMQSRPQEVWNSFGDQNILLPMTKPGKNHRLRHRMWK